MTQKQINAAKNRWQKTPPEERSTIMSKVARAKHKKLSKEERSLNALKMLEKRWGKKYTNEK